MSEVVAKLAQDAKLPARFEPIRILGQGGMGVVIAAFDRVLGREIAVKILRSSEGDEANRRRFVREARAAASLHHPGIVAVHDVDVEGGFIVMELVSGDSLAAHLRERPLAPSEVRGIGVALLAALQAAHEAGIVHRDVKPANVLIDLEGRVKLTDFGIATRGERDLTGTHDHVGTPAYMAPEQLRRSTVDSRADIYSAGVTLFHAATGRMLHAREGSVADPRAVLLETTKDPALTAAILRALEERPEDRHESAAAFSRELERLSLPETAQAPRSKSWIAVAAAIAAIAAIIGAIWIARPKQTSTRVKEDPLRIALLPFDLLRPSPELAFARAGFPQLLAAELERVPGITVVGYYSLLGHVPHPDAALIEWTRAAQHFDADLIVRGELDPHGERVDLRVIVAIPSGLSVKDIRKSVAIAELPETVRHAATEVASAATGKDLLLGVGALEDHKIHDAMRELEAAEKLDPRSPEVQYALAVASWWGDLPRERTLGHIARALEGELPPARRGFLEALRPLVSMNFADAAAKLETLAERFPDDRDIAYARYEALFHGGHAKEAAKIYRRLNEQHPSFRLGAYHMYAYYIAHGDEEGLAWVEKSVGSPEQVTMYSGWSVKTRIARRDYAGAMALAARIIENPRGSDDARQSTNNELVPLYLIRGELDLAVAMQSTVDAGRDTTQALALHIARGLEKEADACRERLLEQLAKLEREDPRWPTIEMWIALVQLELTRGSRDHLTALSKSAPLARYERDLRLHVVRALLAGVLQEGIDEWRASPYPEVAAIAEAFAAEQRGATEEAIRAWRRAIAGSSDGRFMITERAFLVRLLRSQAADQQVIEVCGEIIEPRIFDWSWAAHVGECLEWTAEAHDALGRPDEATAARAKLAAMRARR